MNVKQGNLIYKYIWKSFENTRVLFTVGIRGGKPAQLTAARLWFLEYKRDLLLVLVTLIKLFDWKNNIRNLRRFWVWIFQYVIFPNEKTQNETLNNISRGSFTV